MENPASNPVNRALNNITLIIEPGRQKFLASMLEAWRYRELLLFLAWRSISVRYKQTILGILWVIIQPLVTILVFTVVFGRWAKIPSDNIPYPIFVSAGTIPWSFFAESINRSGESMVANSRLITKIYFPRVHIPLSASLATLLDFGIALLVFSGLMIYYGVVPEAGILALPALTLLTLIISVSIGMFFSALNVRFRDVKYALPFVVQIWMYATPVVYPYSLIPEKFRLIALLNPMVGVIEGFRWAFLGRPFPGMPLLSSCLFAIVAFLLAQAYFRRVERTLADVV